MTTLSTHDTKRSEDVRARITVLAEAAGPVGPDAGDAARSRAAARRRLRQPALAGGVRRLAHLPGPAARLCREGDARGRRPHDVDRSRRGLRARRARGRRRGVRRRAGRAAPRGLDAELSAAGRSNSLAAKLLSLTLPGVPDVYQGSELGDRSLVDPDNRRPVDFDAAGQSLRERVQRQAGAHRPRPPAAPRPARAVHDVHARACRGSGRGARARLRPRWRGHGRDPAAARAGGEGGWGETDLALPGGRPAGGRPAAATSPWRSWSRNPHK